MTKRQSEIYRQKSRLEYQGWELKGTENCVKFNGGSETTHHRVSKTVAASVCIDAGYRVRSEVSCPDGEADILAFGLEGRKPIVIELENSLTEDVADRKREQYLVGDISEVWIIDLDSAPVDPQELYEFIGEQTGLL